MNAIVRYGVKVYWRRLPVARFISYALSHYQSAHSYTVSFSLIVYIVCFYADILYPSVVVSWLAVVLFYCAIWSRDHQVE